MRSRFPHLIAHNLGKFRKWTNILHAKDPIASPLKPIISFVEDIRIKKISLNPHSTYWDHKVVHTTIAREIVDHYQKTDWIEPSKIRVPREIPPEVFRPSQGPSLKAGFSNYFPDFQKVPFDELIRGARKIDICYVYGATWYGRNLPYLVEALKKPKTRVRVCMLSPDSPALPGFAYHFSRISAETLKKRIQGSVVEMKRAFDEATKEGTPVGHLQIYYVKNIINHSTYRFDNLIYFSARQLSSPKFALTLLPLFVFRLTDDTNEFASWLLQDFETLLNTSGDVELHFDSQNP